MLKHVGLMDADSHKCTVKYQTNIDLVDGNLTMSSAKNTVIPSDSDSITNNNNEAIAGMKIHKPSSQNSNNHITCNAHLHVKRDQSSVFSQHGSDMVMYAYFESRL